MKLRQPGVLLIAIVLSTLLPVVVPDLLKNIRVAMQLRAMTDLEKRSTVIGLYYRPLHEIAQSVPEEAAVAIVMGDSWLDRDVGVFANYYLYPRSTMFYRGEESYRLNRYEGFVQGREQPSTVVRIDHSASPEVLLLSRDEMLAAATERN